MLNQQKPEPLDPSDGESLDVIEIFHTIQGEGPYSGWSSIFVRLAGCNLQCPLCDTTYTGPQRRRRDLTSIMRTIGMLLDLHPRTLLVVITGGEPLRQNIAPLCEMLVRHKLLVQIESNGVFSVPDKLAAMIRGNQVMLVVSPKTKAICADTADLAHVYKYVIKHGQIREFDGLPLLALDHKASPFVARPPDGWTGLIYVSPCDDKDEATNSLNLSATTRSALRFGYIMGVQLHKIINLP